MTMTMTMKISSHLEDSNLNVLIEILADRVDSFIYIFEFINMLREISYQVKRSWCVR